MIKQFISRITLGIAAISFLFGLGFATPVQAQGLFDGSVGEACKGASLNESGGCADGSSKLQGIIRVALNLLSAVAGIGAVVMLIIAGIRYATSGGDSSGVSGAKNTIIYAVVGIVIVALAQAIVQFVINRLGREL